jgi:hypothetical protein
MDNATGHTYWLPQNGTSFDPMIIAIVGSDQKMATLILFSLFIVVMMVITIAKECMATGNRREYQMATEAGEGVELCVVADDAVTAQV